MSEKSSKQETARLSNIKKLLKLEDITQKDLAYAIDREPQNLNRDIVHDKISDKTCIKIAEAFPEYNHLWLLGYSDIMLKKEYAKSLNREDESDHIPVDSVINLIKFAGYDVHINKKGDITISDGEEIVCDSIKTKKIINLIIDYVNFAIEHQRCI